VRRRAAPLVAGALLLRGLVAMDSPGAGLAITIPASKTYTTTADYSAPVTVTVTGAVTSPNGSGGTCVFDAFYTACDGRPRGPGGGFYVGGENRGPGNWEFAPRRPLYFVEAAHQAAPAYNAGHRYTFTVACSWSSSGCGRLRFYADPGVGYVYSSYWSGSFGVEIGESNLPIVVDFSARISGVPNIAVGPQQKAGLVKSTVVASGHATFTEHTGTGLLRATESKGSVFQEDVYADGTKRRLELGVITLTGFPSLKGKIPETLYSPNTKRLLLLLKVKESNDSGACPESAFNIATVGYDLRLATLVLLPGARPSAIFTGVPKVVKTGSGKKTTLVEPCLGHTHGWVSDPSDHVTVVLRLNARKP
jgi:hypothetical protein